MNDAFHTMKTRASLDGAGSDDRVGNGSAFTWPVVTAPTATGDTAGLADLNLINLFPFKQ